MIRLTKESSPEMIKLYFEKVFELNESKEKFPVDLDDVWPLAYSRKDKAVDALLKSDFIESVDYQTIHQKGEREIGATITIKYYLSVICFEFFIARKVRPVFEVYRAVFHRYIKEESEIRSLGLDAVKRDGEYYVCHTEALPKIEYSKNSGAAKSRPSRHPDKFKKIFNKWFIKVKFLLELRAAKANLQELPFVEEPKSLEGGSHE